MRANVNLEEDAYNFAYAFSRAHGISLGAGITRLLRIAEKHPEEQSKATIVINEYGYPEVRGTGRKITPEMVKELSEDQY